MRSHRSGRTTNHTTGPQATAKAKTAAKTVASSPMGKVARKNKAPSPAPTPRPVRWRAATAADEGAIVACSLALFREDPGTKAMTAARVRRTLGILAREPARGLAVVAVSGQEVVGHALLVSFLSNELHGEVCIIDELFVDEACRGAGVGTALITALQAGRIPRFRRAVALELEVTPRNRRARALYERLGFAPRKNATMRLLRSS